MYDLETIKALNAGEPELPVSEEAFRNAYEALHVIAEVPVTDGNDFNAVALGVCRVVARSVLKTLPVPKGFVPLDASEPRHHGDAFETEPVAA